GSVELVLEEEPFASIALTAAVIIVEEGGRRDDKQRDPLQAKTLDEADERGAQAESHHHRLNVEDLIDHHGAAIEEQRGRESEHELVEVARIEDGGSVEDAAIPPQRGNRTEQRKNALNVAAVTGTAEENMRPIRLETHIVSTALKAKYHRVAATVDERLH